eukprot:11569922-Ditylum_brightwellii.AAC.1
MDQHNDFGGADAGGDVGFDVGFTETDAVDGADVVTVVVEAVESFLGEEEQLEISGVEEAEDLEPNIACTHLISFFLSNHFQCKH